MLAAPPAPTKREVAPRQAGSGPARQSTRCAPASAKAPLAQPRLLVKSAALLASTIAARALAPLSRRAAPRPHFATCGHKGLGVGQHLAIGSTCENWASEIRFRQFERVDATPLGRRLERCGVSSGSHGRPEPSARAALSRRALSSRALKAPPAGSLPRDETLYTTGTATSLAEQLQPTGPGRRLHGYPGLALRTVVPLRPGAWPVHPVVGYQRDPGRARRRTSCRSAGTWTGRRARAEQ